MEYTKCHASHFWRISRNKPENPKKQDDNTKIELKHSNACNTLEKGNSCMQSAEITSAVEIIENTSNVKHEQIPCKISPLVVSSKVTSPISAAMSKAISVPETVDTGVQTDNVFDNISKNDSSEGNNPGDKQQLKSRISQLIENRHKEDSALSKKTTDNELQEENMQETKEIEEEKDERFDDFIVPLTGFMCTVCHQTLSDVTQALSHQNSYQHKKNVHIHNTKFG